MYSAKMEHTMEVYVCIFFSPSTSRSLYNDESLQILGLVLKSLYHKLESQNFTPTENKAGLGISNVYL